MNSAPLRPPPGQTGYTLVEMLVVMAISMLLLSLSLMALKSLAGTTSLNGAGNIVTDTFAYARQEAISKNTLSTVVIVTQAGAPEAYATLSVWEYSATAGAWSQATTWKNLPVGIVFDNGTANSAFASSYITNSPGATPALTNITYLGNTALTPGTAGSPTSQNYACQTFLPSGRLYSTTSIPYSLFLVEGAYNSGGTLTYTHLSPNSSSTPANYVAYYFNPTDGEAKVVRP